ncbi:MAG: TIGR04211 family SH3 domain-containing protein [Deltaproteobacteria bacterium]
MKYSVLFLVCFCLPVTAAYGQPAGVRDNVEGVSVLGEGATRGAKETRYVTEKLSVMVRTGPDLNRKIIAMPQSGTSVEILEVVDDEWVKVRLPNEKEGWMKSQFLVSGPPSKQMIGRLQKENSTLSLQKKNLAEENARLKKERKELENALSKQTKRADSLGQSYEVLKSGSKEYLALKASYEKASQELTSKTKQVGELKKEVESLRNGQTLRWFIAGASVILVGFIIGYASRRPKRRSSLL